ncbi:protein jag [Truepera radiovictrix]|uniref:Single-stranded nucleic acid binding R3H domain protein n=1 Tax=Truepera radiovictrix (strain DSM 17093 / CIP 108686 / LMG 22925 / RQ-24) TaxID=649638 RepID=D7CRM0_TRURR|nr:R3H domain-containing nucleic acid-binding protein [Truepera radiovictrix]ADI13510.1 single-stranded nucleic acid binding R3H domain protein [Truepera radiovictrix DSM 17093]WMT57928.1 R3H domain-containing nucleic acid-binding protein [Truepera radiovictrix]
MASDLDKYLSDLGIDTEDEAQPKLPTAPQAAAAEPAPSAAAEGSAAERLEAFLVGLLLHLDPGYAVEVTPAGERELRAEVVGGDPGKIIGRGGRTLAALEYLANAVLNRDEGAPHVRASLDVGGYRARRDERLRGVALKAAARARKTGLAVELEPMSAAERRVIHMTLADDPSVESASSGEGRERRVVVRPVG